MPPTSKRQSDLPVSGKRSSRWTVPVLLMLLAGCSSGPPIAAPRQHLPLPQEARQSPPPRLCQPTCSAGLSELLSCLLSQQEDGTAKVSPACKQLMESLDGNQELDQ